MTTKAQRRPRKTIGADGRDTVRSMDNVHDPADDQKRPITPPRESRRPRLRRVPRRLLSLGAVVLDTVGFLAHAAGHEELSEVAGAGAIALRAAALASRDPRQHGGPVA